MAAQLPLPVVWRVPVGGHVTPLQAPVLAEGTVTVRAGEELVRLATVDGRRLWLAMLPDRSGSGTFLHLCAGLLLTDIVRHPERFGSVVAMREDGGEPAWRVDLPGIVAPAGSLVVDDVLHVLVTEPAEGEVVAYTLDARTGEQLRRLVMPWGADGLIPRQDGLLVRNQVAAQGSPGLYTVEWDGTARAVSADRAWRFSAQNGLVLISSGDAPRELGELRVLAADDLRQLWWAPAVVEAAVLDGGQVFAVDRTAAGDVLVARRASDGAEQWRTSPLERPVGTVNVCGPLVFCSFLAGRLLRRRSDGEPAGQLTGFYSPPAADRERLYVVGNGELLCLHLADIRE